MSDGRLSESSSGPSVPLPGAEPAGLREPASLHSVVPTTGNAERALNTILHSAKCILWQSVVTDVNGFLDWRTTIYNESAAQSWLPVDMENAPSYGIAAWMSRPDEDRDRLDAYVNACIRAGVSRYEQDYRVRRADGEIVWLHEDATIESAGNGSWRVVGVCTDITATKRAAELLSNRALQQAAVAEFARYAVEESDVLRLCEVAVSSIATALDVSEVSVWELLPDRQTLLLIADSIMTGSPVRPDRTLVSNTLAGYATRSESTVIVEDAFAETRFDTAAMTSVGFRSGIAVPLKREEPVFGSLGVYSFEQRAFSEHDAHFCEAMANILATAIQRDRARRLSAAQQAVAEILVGSESPSHAYPRVLEALCRHFVWEYGEVWGLLPESGELECLGTWQSPARSRDRFQEASRSLRVRPGNGLIGRVWESRQPLWISDISRSNLFIRKEAAFADHLQAGLAFPILVEDKAVGVISLFASNEQLPDEEVIASVATIGRLMGRYVERITARDDLVRREHELARAEEIAHLGSWTLELGKNRIEWSDETFRIFGMTPGMFDSLSQEFFYHFVHPDDVESLKATLHRALAERTTYDVDHRILLHDGTVRHVHERGKVICGENGQPLRIDGTVQDITERKHEEQLRIAMYGIAAAGHDTSDLHAFYRTIHAHLKTLVAAKNFYIALSVPENPGWFHFVYGVDEKEIFYDQPFPYPKSVTAHVAAQRTPLTLRNEEIEPYAAERGLEFYGWRPAAWMGVPLAIGETVIGVMAVQSYDPTVRYTEHDVETMMFIGRQIAAAIERKRTQDTLAHERSLFNLIMENSPTLIYFKDENSRYTRVNRAEAAMLGISDPSNVAGKTDFDFYPEELARQFYEDERRIFASGKPLLDKIEPQRIDEHTQIWLLTSKVPILDEENRIRGILGISRDVTRIVEAESALRELTVGLEHEVKERTLALGEKMEELARSNQELQQFAYIASHDLNQPLRTISNFAGLLQKRYRGKLDANADDFIRYIVESAQRMQLLIQSLLDYSRVETQGKEFASADFESIMERTLRGLTVAIQERGAVVTYDSLPTLRVDETQIGRLLQNLIENAVKFCDKKQSKVHVSAVRKNREWVFAVADNGIGIPPEHQERIFGIFQRFNFSADVPGTGIGLAICKRIVERHGGRIWVESKPNRGATFHFTVPIQ